MLSDITVAETAYFIQFVEVFPVVIIDAIVTRLLNVPSFSDYTLNITK